MFQMRSDYTLAGRTGVRGLGNTLLAAASLAMLAGCSMHRDSVTVGSIPDDYRTNHPIVIGEKAQVLDLPVAASDRGMTHSQKIAIRGFMAYYDRSAAPVVTVLSPYGSANAAAAADATSDFVGLLCASGVPEGRIAVASYTADPAETVAPVRITYNAMRAQTNKCGRWPADMLENAENKHYANFGCAYQNNLAAQIAEPADLLGPRKSAPIDAENRGNAIDQYKARAVVPDFNGNSEIEY